MKHITVKEDLLSLKRKGRSSDMKILKLIICTTILLGLVAAIMLVCNAWNARIFTTYVAVAILTIAACIWSHN